jgi:membrane fusion protein (multidrug efflux system)
MIKRFILMLVAVGLIFGGIFGWKFYQLQQYIAHAPKPQPVTVASADVQEESWTPYLYSVGSLVATQGIAVTNEVPGQVKAIHFHSGEQVKEGELLLELDDSVDRAQLDGARAEQRLAEIRFKRSSDLLKKKAISKADYDVAVANLDNAKAQVRSQLEVVHKKQIKAPFSGLLGIRQVDIGEYLSPGSPIVPLQALNPIFVDYSLPEQRLGRLSVGQTLTLSVKSSPGRVFQGHISAINPGIEPTTRNVRIRGTLENADHVLRPGMFAEVQTHLPMRKGILTVPRTAITYAPYGDSVFAIQEQNGGLAVKRVQVQTGEVRGDRVEITRGLKAGQRIVTAGQLKLRNGQAVVIDNSVKVD